MADWERWHSTSSIFSSGEGGPGECGVVGGSGSGSSTWTSGCGPGLGEVRSTGVLAPDTGRPPGEAAHAEVVRLLGLARVQLEARLRGPQIQPSLRRAGRGSSCSRRRLLVLLGAGRGGAAAVLLALLPLAAVRALAGGGESVVEAAALAVLVLLL